jgi:hypothetical protein
MPNWITTLFGSPWTLVWLPAATIPIVIHLWNRRKYREMSWAAMEYLLAAIVKSSRRMRIEQLLLLAVRTLLVLLVVLALAEPFLDAVASPLVRRARTHRVLVLDGSFSMAYQPADKHVFEIAKEMAIEIVEDGNEGDAYSLILMSDTPRTIVGTAAYDRGDFITEIEKTTLPHGGANLPPTITAVEQIVQQVRQDQPQLTRHHVYILTDLQRRTWALEGRSDKQQKELQERLDRLSQQGMVEVLPVGGPAGDNLAVTQLAPDNSYAVVGRPVWLEAAVHNFSNQEKSRQLAELWVNGRRADQRFVDVLPGDQTPSIRFEHRFQSHGDHAVELRLGGDSLDVDNHRYLSLPVKEHLDALVVSGKRGSTLPLEAALDGGDFSRGMGGIIRPQVVSESALLELELKRFDCVFLCNVGQFTASEALVLQGYLEQGGGLVTILGDQVLPDRYNRELGGVGGGVRVLPARIGPAYYDGTYHFFDPLDYRHPWLAAWQGNPKTGLLTVPVLKFFRLELPEDGNANVVLGLNTGDPAIVEESIRGGRSILIATDVSTASVVDAANPRRWSLIASWLNFQPLLEGIWQAAVGGKIDERNVLVGDELSFRFDAASGNSRVSMTKPQSALDASALAGRDDTGRWSFGNTETSGIYTAEVENSDLSPKKFAVNVTTEESDLEKVHPEDLPPKMLVRSGNEDIEMPPSAAIPPPSFALHQLLLCAVLGLLFVETFLAWWIGHHSA